MSEQNIEIVRHSVEAINRGDVEAALSYTDPDGELYSAIVGGAEGNVYRGHDGFRRWYADVMQSFEELTTELTEFRDLGEVVVAFGRVRARGRESGVALDTATGWVFTVRNGKVVRAEGFLSHAEASKPPACRSRALTTSRRARRRPIGCLSGRCRGPAARNHGVRSP